MNKYKILFLVGNLFFQEANADLLEYFGLKKEKKIDLVIGSEKSMELKALRAQLITFEKSEKEFEEDIASVKVRINAEITNSEGFLETITHNKFINAKILVLRSTKQILSEMKAAWKVSISSTKANIELLEEYTSDPQFSSLKLEKKSVYTIEDLKHLTEIIASQDDKITHIQSKKTESQVDLDNKKKKQISLERHYKEKLKKQEEFASDKSSQNKNGLAVHEQAQLLDYEVELAKYEYEYEKLRVQEEKSHLDFIITQMYISEKKRNVLRQKRDLMIRMSFRVDEHDVQRAEKNLLKKNGNTSQSLIFICKK